MVYAAEFGKTEYVEISVEGEFPEFLYVYLSCDLLVSKSCVEILRGRGIFFGHCPECLLVCKLELGSLRIGLQPFPGG